MGGIVFAADLDFFHYLGGLSESWQLLSWVIVVQDRSWLAGKSINSYQGVTILRGTGPFSWVFFSLSPIFGLNSNLFVPVGPKESRETNWSKGYFDRWMMIRWMRQSRFHFLSTLTNRQIQPSHTTNSFQYRHDFVCGVKVLESPCYQLRGIGTPFWQTRNRDNTNGIVMNQPTNLPTPDPLQQDSRMQIDTEQKTETWHWWCPYWARATKVSRSPNFPVFISIHFHPLIVK